MEVNQMQLNIASPSMVELGRCIRNIREASGLTAEELASRAGCITRPSLTRREIGKANAPAFDSVYGLLRAVGKLDIIRNGDFDFRPYSKETVELIHFFTADEKETTWVNYGNAVSKQIAEGCANWSKDELYPLIVYVQCKNGMDCVKHKASKVSHALTVRGMNAEALDYNEVIKYIVDNTEIAFQYRQFVLNFMQDNRHDKLYEMVGDLFEKLHLYITQFPIEDNELEELS
jgi:transcriptional regulator with XRE-family HTH domain